MMPTNDEIRGDAQAAVTPQAAGPRATGAEQAETGRKLPEREYNDGHLHEAMHLTWVLMETFSNYVLEAPACQRFPEAADKANDVADAMFDLYQLLGQRWAQAQDAAEGDAPSSPSSSSP